MTAPNDTGVLGRDARGSRAQLDVTPDPQLIRATADRDGTLVDALRRRDPTAAERLLETYGDRVYRLARRITGNEQDAEEVVQDAFWSVLRHIDTFRGESLFGSWIYRITANAAYQKLRRAAHRRDEISSTRFCPSSTTATITSTRAGLVGADRRPRDSERAARRPGLGHRQLPANHRAVIVLHDVEGLSMAEVAAALGISLATAKTTAHRARLRLRKRLGMFLSPTTSAVNVPA